MNKLQTNAVKKPKTFKISNAKLKTVRKLKSEARARGLHKLKLKSPTDVINSKKPAISKGLAAFGAGQVRDYILNKRVDRNTTTDTGADVIKAPLQGLRYARNIKEARTTLQSMKEVKIELKGKAKNNPKGKPKVKRLKTRGKFGIKTSKTKSGVKTAQAALKRSKQIAMFVKEAAAHIMKGAAAVANVPQMVVAVLVLLLLIVFLAIINSVAASVVGAANAVIEDTIGWLLPKDSNDKSDAKLKQEFDNYMTVAAAYTLQWAADNGYDGVKGDTTKFGIELLTILFANKVKNNPNISIENVRFTDSEIQTFASKFLQYAYIEINDRDDEHTYYYVHADQVDVTSFMGEKTDDDDTRPHLNFTAADYERYNNSKEIINMLFS